jgi:L-malate glycosyltransferase
VVIAHVIDSMEVGSPETVVAALCRLQTEGDHAVSVHCLFEKGLVAEQLERAGVSVYVPWTGFLGGDCVAPVPVVPGNTPRRRPLPQQERDGARGGSRAARTCPHADHTRHGMAALPYRLRKELKFWINAALFCDRVVAVCDAARRNMTAGAAVVAHKIVTIRNGAYPPLGGTDTRVHKKGFTLVSVGRFAPAKSYETFLRSVALARRHVPDLVLRIVGDGSDSRSLRQLSRELELDEVVEFCGERSDVGTWLRCADVFVLSSLSEGLPISILEAMAVGLPAIVTDVGGMPEVIGLSRAGRTVPARDTETLASAIVDFAGRRDELKQWGERASACYRQHFTPEHMAEQYFAWYQACFSTRGGEV